jgi:hypothetical protein
MALKPCYSRASQDLKKIYPQQTLPNFNIDVYNPWIAQEWIEGDRFCTYTVCYNGKIHAHGVYPVKYAINGTSCLTFEYIEHPGILEWVTDFIEKTNFTGQIAFDFIQAYDKTLYAIECNPRATSGILLFHEKDRIDQAFLKKVSDPIFPQYGCRKQIAAGMLLYGWRKVALPNNRTLRFLKDFFSTKDVIFRSKDIKPFLFEPLIFAHIWIKSKKYRLSLPASFTFDHDWNGEKINLT